MTDHEIEYEAFMRMNDPDDAQKFSLEPTPQGLVVRFNVGHNDTGSPFEIGQSLADRVLAQTLEQRRLEVEAQQVYDEACDQLR